MAAKTHGLLPILIGLGSIAVIVLGCSAGARNAQMVPKPDYFAPARQADSPRVAWVRQFDSGVGGDLICDRTGAVYLWYETDSHVLKYDRRGKVLWSKRFAPRGQNAWGGILSNPKGDLFLMRTIGGTTIVSGLLADGTLRNDIRLRNGPKLVTGLSAMDVTGGFLALDSITTGSDQNRRRQYLAKYSRTGTRQWSIYLQDLNLGPATILPMISAALDLEVDAQGNSYLLLGDITRNGILNTRLKKYLSNGKPAWSTQLRLTSDPDLAMKVDAAGNTYFSGQITGLGYFVAKVNSSGKLVSVRRPTMKGGGLEALKIAIDGKGNTYIAGSASRVKGRDKVTPFVAKHDGSGKLQWRKELPKITLITGLAVDRDNVYVSGAVQDGVGEMYLIKLGR